VQEDNEVEPGNISTRPGPGGMFQSGKQLTVVGGFDFMNGVADPYYSRRSGRLPATVPAISSFHQAHRLWTGPPLPI